MALTATDLKNMKYAPELFPDAICQSIAAVTALSTPPLVLTTLQDEGMFARLTDLQSIAAAAPANVVAQPVADGASYPPSGFSLSTSYLPSGGPERGVLDLTAASSLQLQFSNGGSATATNYQAAWSLWGWRPTLADYLAQRLTPPAELAALSKLLPPGFAPSIVPQRMIETFFARPQVMAFSSTANVAAGGTTPLVIAAGNPPSGWFDVIRFVAVDDSVGGTITLANRVTNNVQVNYARDGVDPLRTIPAYGINYYPSLYATPDTSRVNGFPSFIVSRASWRVYLTATAKVSSVPYMVLAWRLVEQPVHRLLWGLGTASDLALPGRVAGTTLQQQIQSGAF